MSTWVPKVSTGNYRCRRSEACSCGRHAFTIVEMLVVAAVVAVLIALALPGLAGVRMRGFESRSMSNLRQIGISAGLYTGSERAYPFARSGWIRPPSGPSPFGMGFPVWHLDVNWPSIMHGYAPWSENYRVWIAPGSDPDPWLQMIDGRLAMSRLPVSYEYSNSFVAQPGAWAEIAPDLPESLVRAVRPHQVRFPSSKVIFFDAERAYTGSLTQGNGRRAVLLTDGSARLWRDADATLPVTNHAGQKYQPLPRYFHDTPNGVDGRDLQ